MPVSAGDINDMIALLTTVTVIVAGWMKWGRHWLSKRRDERRLILDSANTIPKLAETQEANGKALQALQTRDMHFHSEFSRLHDRLDSQDITLESIQHRIAGAWDSDPVPQFVCGLDGRNIDVNQAYADMLGVDKRHLIGWGFKNFIESDEAYIAEWMSCLKDHRVFTREAVFTTATGKRMKCSVRAWPQPENPPARAWHGHITVTGTV